MECSSDNLVNFGDWLADHGGAVPASACGSITWSTNPQTPSLSDDCGSTGASSVWFIARDECGNVDSMMATFTVVDTIAPTFTAPSDITIYLDSLCNYQVATSLTGDVTDEMDNCSTLEATYTDAFEETGCGTSGQIRRTWTLIDACGNEAQSQDQIITVLDTVAPALDNAAPIEYILGTLPDTFSFERLQVDTSLYCDMASMDTTEMIIMTCAQLGLNTMEVMLTDECGNTRMQTITINVVDAFGQCVDCPSSLVISDPNLPSNTYRALEITSNARIQSGSQVTFKAQNHVNMIRPFTVDNGAVFDVIMEDCQLLQILDPPASKKE